MASYIFDLGFFGLDTDAGRCFFFLLDIRKGLSKSEDPWWLKFFRLHVREDIWEVAGGSPARDKGIDLPCRAVLFLIVRQQYDPLRPCKLRVMPYMLEESLRLGHIGVDEEIIEIALSH